MSRFNYVKYDETAAKKQAHLKAAFENLEGEIEANVPNGRAKSLVLTKLEEAYMWVGKGIRDEQVTIRGLATEQAERINS